MPFLRRTDGCRLYYETYGKPDAEPLLLLGGLGGDIPGWRRNVPALSRERFVVALDFRGNGRSDGIDAAVTMETFVEDAVALLDELGLAAAHVYGQSFGGMVGQLLALEHPDRVRSLILAATHPGGERAVRSDARGAKGRPHLSLYSERFARENPQHVREDLRSGSRQRPGDRRAQWEAMQRFDAYDRLTEIRVPTLVLHGSEDRMVPPQNARLLAEHIPGAELVLQEGAGHVYHSEQTEAADRAVLDFVRRQSHG